MTADFPALSAASAMLRAGDEINTVAYNIANISMTGSAPLPAPACPPGMHDCVFWSFQAGSGPPGIPPDSFSTLSPEENRPAGTDIIKEFTQMIASENDFDANAVVIRTVDELSGIIINRKI